MSNKVLVLYVPVLHQGYIAFFERWRRSADTIYILGPEFTAEFALVEREIRAVEPRVMGSLISASGFFAQVAILSRTDLPLLSCRQIVTADESISRRFVEKYLPGGNVEYDSVFLRWDERHVSAQKPPESFAVSTDMFDRQMMQRAVVEGRCSSCWWRRVGAILVRDGIPLISVHNTHMPTEHSPYALGDIRDFIPAGQNSDIQSVLHAEKQLVCAAARQRIRTEGADIYVNVFPCSDCAKVVAAAGFKRCFFGGGHASFHGEDVLRFFEVELIFVDVSGE